jgi:hypothetical protein
MVPVGVSKPQYQTSCRLESQGINELLAQQTLGDRTRSGDALLVEQVEGLQLDRLGMRRFSHISL